MNFISIQADPSPRKVNGTHLAADSSSFLEKRRRGLVRFTNALIQHPVLSQEQLVVMFLTVPTVRPSPPIRPHPLSHTHTRQTD
jgi:PX domain